MEEKKLSIYVRKAKDFINKHKRVIVYSVALAGITYSITKYLNDPTGYGILDMWVKDGNLMIKASDNLRNKNRICSQFTLEKTEDLKNFLNEFLKEEE